MKTSLSIPTVSVFGLGYVGLTFAACLAHRGLQVIGYDTDIEKLKTIAVGQPPFYEPALQELLTKTIQEGGLRLTVDSSEAMAESEVTFITVGTPEQLDGSVDLTFVLKTIKTIGQSLRSKGGWHLVAIKSTVPPGTGRKVARLLEERSGKKCGRDFGLCVNPEFLREGNAVEDIMNPDRIIIGEYNEKSGETLENLYRSFHGETSPPIVRTSLENAELIKYASNAFLAMKISYINMIARLCEKIPGADVEEVAKGIGLDKRIGPYFLKAGLGWGGSCFPKDLKALSNFGRQLSVDLPLVEATIKVNDSQPYKAIEFAEKLIGNLAGKRIAILGLAFKPNTDDMRYAVSIKIINGLLEKKATVVAYDPKAMDIAKKIFGHKIQYANTVLDCIRDADCTIIVTEWDEFKSLKPEVYIEKMRSPALVDGRRMYDPKELPPNIKYEAVGLGAKPNRKNGINR
ncbi:MAG: UDP-glucose/GDP-mannose dehydrogenase family protein [Candidatus Bathyarchaeia archaeon]